MELPNHIIKNLIFIVIDLIENAKKSEKETNEFNIIFNFNMNIDCVIKGEVKLFG